MARRGRDSRLNPGSGTDIEGLAQAKQIPRRFEQKSFPLGREQNFRWDKALEMAAEIEDAELQRTMSLQK